LGYLAGAGGGNVASEECRGRVVEGVLRLLREGA